ncbi:hypothetical protein [Nocardioides sp. LHG3406-4]|uniref:hypothetical protein n=1 Tax=Nocardioides sp. LHG3406-4 TaxID=2804575 RepID=UPI003CF195B9
MTISNIPGGVPQPRLEATHFDGEVLIRTNPATARLVAQAWALLNKDQTEVNEEWGHEVVDMMRAAAMADAQLRTTLPAAVRVRPLRLLDREADQ